MNQEEIDEHFREVASKTTEDGNIRIEDSFYNLERASNSESRRDKLLDFASEQMCFASELMLKGSLVYDDFRRCNKYLYDTNGSCIVGTSGWNEALSSFTSDRNLSDMKDPKKILRDVILTSNPNDERSNISLEQRDNSDGITLSLRGDKVTGHNLYALYQIQSPISRSLIDTEYYCKVNDSVKWTIIAILTDDIIKTDSNGKTIMPKKMMEVLDKVKEDAVNLRYSSMSDIHVSDDQDKLPFLIDFSTSVQSVSNFRFPEPDNYKKIDFSNCNFDVFNNHLSRLSFLDKTTKYRLLTLFNQNEINSLLNFMNLNGNSIKLVYNAIYLKDYIKNVLDINLEFTEKQFIRINDLCNALKAYQLFDSSSKRLEDCISSSEKDIYIHRCEEMSNSNLKTKHMNLFESLKELYSEDEICNLLNSEEYKKYPHLFTVNTLKVHDIGGIKALVNSSTFLEHKDLFSEKLLTENALIPIYICFDNNLMSRFPGLICKEVLEKYNLSKVFEFTKQEDFIKNYSFTSLKMCDYNLDSLAAYYSLKGYDEGVKKIKYPSTTYIPGLLSNNLFRDLIKPVQELRIFHLDSDGNYVLRPISDDARLSEIHDMFDNAIAFDSGNDGFVILDDTSDDSQCYSPSELDYIYANVDEDTNKKK